MFKSGDKIVCPIYGAGTIEKIFQDTIDGNKINLIKISLIHSNMQLLIPENMVEQNKIRSLSSDAQIKKALRALKKEPIKPSDDDMREITSNLTGIIKNSNIIQSAEWMSKLIYRRRNHGQLNSSEKKLYLNIKSLIAGELSLRNDIDYKEAEKAIDKIIKKNIKLSDQDIELLGFDIEEE